MQIAYMTQVHSNTIRQAVDGCFAASRLGEYPQTDGRVFDGFEGDLKVLRGM